MYLGGHLSNEFATEIGKLNDAGVKWNARSGLAVFKERIQASAHLISERRSSGMDYLYKCLRESKTAAMMVV